MNYELLSKRDESKRRMLNRGRMQQSDGTEEMVDEYLANKRPLLLGMWRQKRIRKNCDSIVMKFTQRRIDSEQQNSHEHKHYRHFYYFIITIKNTNIWIQTHVDWGWLLFVQITDDVVVYFDSPYLFIIHRDLWSSWLIDCLSSVEHLFATTSQR